MEKRDYLIEARRELSELNEIRSIFWRRLRAFRSKLLKRPGFSQDDPDYEELYALANDMWESGSIEEIRRKKGGKGRGLYASDRLCTICGLPLRGKQQKYCSGVCLNKAKQRLWRRRHK